MKKHLLSLYIVAVAAPVVAQLPVSTAQENRKVLVEEFTGITCQYCPDGHKKADQLISANPTSNFVINVHTGGYANPASGAPDFRTAFGSALASQSGLVGYPAGTVNRHLFSALSQNTTTPGTAMSRGAWANAAGQIESMPSILNVALQGTIDATTRKLTVDVEVYYTGTSTVSTNYFNLALIQDSILGPQTGATTWYPQMMVGSQYQHNKMLRHLLTGQWGDPINTTTAGSMIAKQYTYTIPAQLPLTVTNGAIKTDVLLSKLKIIGFVTETQQEVLSANKGPITIVSSSPTGIEKYDAKDEYSATLFPNPTADKSTLALLLSKNGNVSVKVYNLLGSQVYSYQNDLEKGMHAINIDCRNYESGVYFVQITIDGKVRTEKLVISR